MRKHSTVILVISATVLAVALVAISALSLGGSVSGTKASARIPSTLVGHWSSDPGATGVNFHADITHGSIEINIVDTKSDSSSKYWMGTFNGDLNPRSSFQYISYGDPDAMALSILGSEDKTKDFVYKNGVLSYKFTALGTTVMVHLTK